MIKTIFRTKNKYKQCEQCELRCHSVLIYFAENYIINSFTQIIFIEFLNLAKNRPEHLYITTISVLCFSNFFMPFL